MRWKSIDFSNEMSRIHWIWLWLPALVLLAFLGPFFVLEWLEKRKRVLMGPSKEWRPWFAWFPVRFDHDLTTVWLEWIERRSPFNDEFLDYRPRTVAAESSHPVQGE